MPRSSTVAVTIPTRNAAGTLAACLASVRAESGPIEIVIADDRSNDGTISIAHDFGAQIIQGPARLLEARWSAFEATSSEYVLLLDADQVVKPGTIDRCRQMLEEFDALILGENSTPPSSFVGRLLEADRRMLHNVPHHMDPRYGSLLPRAFRRALLADVFGRISFAIRRVVLGQDHALITRIVGDIGARIGLLPDALTHREVETLAGFMKKNYRWGLGDAELFHIAPELREVPLDRLRGRLRRGNVPLRDFAKSVLLMAIKATPYATGYTRRAWSIRMRPRREAAAHEEP